MEKKKDLLNFKYSVIPKTIFEWGAKYVEFNDYKLILSE